MRQREVIRQIERDRAFYDESRGGVTFSGGEPFYQPDFLGALLEACREKNIHTAVETCGFVKPDVLRALKEKIDVFLYDLKMLDPLRHRQYVGVSNDLILENLERLARDGTRPIVRIPLIPSVNDSDDEMLRLGRFLHKLRIPDVHLLPYHRTGSAKYARLQMHYQLQDLEPPSSESVLRVASKLEEDGLTVSIGGQP